MENNAPDANTTVRASFWAQLTQIPATWNGQLSACSNTKRRVLHLQRCRKESEGARVCVGFDPEPVDQWDEL